MLEEREREWFEKMRQESIKPSYQTLINARKKIEKARAKKEFLEEHLPIIIICGLNVCLGIAMGLVCSYMMTGVGQKYMIMSLTLGLSYVPLVVYSSTVLYTKNSQNKKEKLKWQDQ